MAAAALSTLVLVSLTMTGATIGLDNTLYDWSLTLRHQKPRADIVIVSIDHDTLNRVGEWPWPRTKMAELIGDIASGHPKALACHFFFLFPSPKPQDDKVVAAAMARARTYLGVPHQDTAPGAPVVTPVPVIAAAAKGVGAGDGLPDPDGIVRRTFLFEGLAGHQKPRMVLQMAEPDVHLSGVDMAQEQKDGMLIPFVGPKGSFKQVRAIDVLDGRVAKDAFTGKYVLLGATAPELLDNYPTPRSTTEGMPSVEVDANILNSLLTGVTITAVTDPWVLIGSLCLLWLLLIALVRLGPRENLLFAASMTGAPLAVSVFGVVVLGIWFPPSPYVVTVAAIVPYWGWRRLNAVSGYFANELRALEPYAGDEALTQAATPALVGGDVVLQQMMLLEDTKRRISDLRQFVADILANFPDPVLVVDRAGQVLTVNPAAREFADRVGAATTHADRIEPILAGITPLPGEIRPLWPPPDNVDEFGSSASERPLTGAGPLGRIYELRFTATRSAADEATGWIVHLADITPLMSAIRQREEALQLLSHDMRSPLSAILATLEHPDFQSAPADLRQRIAGQAARTVALADDFTRLAKAESGTYQLEPIDLGHVLSDAADAVWALAHAGGVKVKLDIGDDEHVVLADRGQLTRALVNLLDNAVKFSQPGRQVTCRLRPDELNGTPAVACLIAANAGGMGPAQLATLFRKFASNRDALNGSAGIGLGLALVQTVISRHDGVINCDSIEGQGTTFTIVLPLHEETFPQQATHANLISDPIA